MQPRFQGVLSVSFVAAIAIAFQPAEARPLSGGIARMLRFVAICGLCLPGFKPVWAANFYVSTSGNDHNPGTLAQPWRTIQHACNTVPAGSVVQIRAGVYHEKIQVNVSGSASGGWIVIGNYPNEKVTVNGQGLKATAEINSIGSDSIFLIQDRDYIRISGLEIVNNDTSVDPAGTDGSGIRVYGGGDHIALIGNTIHHTRGHDDMGITVYGTEASRPILNLTIDNNVIYDCTPAHSETLTLNGNVDTFEVAGNVIHNVDNIGIDCIGGEKKCADPSRDAARHGSVHHNTVSYVHSSYDSAAAAIYVDGGHDIEIYSNAASFSDEGIEIGAENKGITAYNIGVHDNVIFRNRANGIIFGGYNPNTTGSVDHLQFVNNTCYQNDTTNQGNGELQIQYHATNILIKNNIFAATGQNLLISWDPNDTTVSSITLDYNLYFCPGGAGNAQFSWQNQTYASFAAYQQGSGQDAHSPFTDPLFVNAGSSNFRLQTIPKRSPAIDAGDPGFQPTPGQTDYYGGPRVLGGRVDIGADEAA